MSFLYYQPTQNGDLDGIIKYFRDNLGDNFPDGFINTSCSTVFRNSEKPENTLYENENTFTTKNESPNWVGYHLAGYLYLQAYTIRVINMTDYYNDFPVNWTVYGTNDTEHFYSIEVRNTNGIFTYQGQSETFTIEHPQTFSNFYILLNGVNSNSSRHLRFSQIEFFGAFTTTNINLKNIFNQSFTISCKTKHNTIIFIIVSLFIKK